MYELKSLNGFLQLFIIIACRDFRHQIERFKQQILKNKEPKLSRTRDPEKDPLVKRGSWRRNILIALRQQRKAR